MWKEIGQCPWCGCPVYAPKKTIVGDIPKEIKYACDCRERVIAMQVRPFSYEVKPFSYEVKPSMKPPIYDPGYNPYTPWSSDTYYVGDPPPGQFPTTTCNGI